MRPDTCYPHTVRATPIKPFQCVCTGCCECYHFACSPQWRWSDVTNVRERLVVSPSPRNKNSCFGENITKRWCYLFDNKSDDWWSAKCRLTCWVSPRPPHWIMTHNLRQASSTSSSVAWLTCSANTWKQAPTPGKRTSLQRLKTSSTISRCSSRCLTE